MKRSKDAQIRSLRHALKIALDYVETRLREEEDPGVGEAIEEDIEVMKRALKQEKAK